MKLQDMRAIVREALEMDRDPTINEIALEIASLQRKAARGALDERSEKLAIQLGVLDSRQHRHECPRA